MKTLSHSGVIVPIYVPMGYSVSFKGQKMQLEPLQEEMAVAWVRKLGTEYASDPVFVRNFFGDFSKALGIKGKVGPEDFDFSEIVKVVNAERAARESMGKDEKKRLASERKAQREANKEKYGYAILDGERVELGNYMVEPSSIFMGRGKHPLRGKWKQGAREEDIVLNLSPEAKRPDGRWKIVWNPDMEWIASWDDKLTGKRKYIWFSDSSPLKHEKDMQKFQKAMELEKNYGRIMDAVREGIDSADEKIRKVATVAYLIDALCMRVGDEKDEDEADTVGATTLTRKNIIFEPDGSVKFDFLGKDSVHWEKSLRLPENVSRNLKEFMQKSDVVFDGIRSDDVNDFLSSIVEGVTSKVFRTFYASRSAREYLEHAKVSKEDPEYVKRFVATMANLQAAKVCNHKRKLPKNWKASLEKKEESFKTAKEKSAAAKKAGKRKPTAKSKERLDGMKLKLEAMKETKDYNLGTSLKNYINPEVFFKWSNKVGYDWKKYYPKTLQKKFSWVESKVKERGSKKSEI